MDSLADKEAIQTDHNIVSNIIFREDNLLFERGMMGQKRYIYDSE